MDQHQCKPKPSSGKACRFITLESSEGDKFLLKHHETRASKLIQDAIEDELDSDDDTDADGTNENGISLVNVQSKTLRNVVNFLRHHAIEPLQPLPSQLAGSSFEEIIQQEWYLRFINDLPSKKELFDIVAASNYMDIQALFDLGCLKVSFELMDKSPEEIRKILNLPKLSKEEEEAAREEHPWIFEE